LLKKYLKYSIEITTESIAESSSLSATKNANAGIRYTDINSLIPSLAIVKLIYPKCPNKKPKTEEKITVLNVNATRETGVIL